MISKNSLQGINNSIDNVFEGIPTAKNETVHFREFIESHDFSPHTVKAFFYDIRKFAQYFANSNKEPFDATRATVMDLTSFKKHYRETKQQSVATVNRSLVSIRRYFDWLVDSVYIKSNPAKIVKELHRQPLVPRGLDRSQVRKLLREVDLRNDIRSSAIFNLFLHTGCRVSDLVQIELQYLTINDRSGSVVFRNGKGNKERQVPLPLFARKAIQEYLAVRPSVQSPKLFIGERGPITDIGIRALCNKYSIICGFKIHPHLLRHSMAHQFLKDNNNDIVGLAQILGHQNIQTSARYTQRSQNELSEASEKLEY